MEDLAAGEAVVETHAAVHDPDGGAHGLALALDIVARHASAAAIGFEQGGEDAQGGGLAGAVGPQKTVHLTGGNGEAQVIDREHLPERLGYSVGDYQIKHDGPYYPGRSASQTVAAQDRSSWVRRPAACYHRG